MPTGNQQPFISHEHVRSALEGMIYASAERPVSPLAFLLVIEQTLLDPDFPKTENARLFVLQQFLSALISDETDRQRALFGMIVTTKSREDALRDIKNCAQINSPELMGWIWLKYRYVDVDLNLSQDAFADTANINDRTLRRYQRHTIQRLTERIIQIEWDTRRAQRKRHLHALIPITQSQHLIGRGDTLQQITQQLHDDTLPLWITGAPGIGKSAFVAQLIHQQIDAERVDQVVWIERPASVESVRLIVIQNTLREQSHMSLREFVLTHHIAVILDDVAALQPEATALSGLLEELRPAQILMTSRHYFPIANALHRVLGEIQPEDTRQIVTHMLPDYGESARHYATSIYYHVGGNPLAIRIAVSNARFLDFAATVRVSVTELFTHIHDQLDPRLKTAWYVFALFPPGAEVDPVALSQLWPARINPEIIGLLLERHLINAAGLAQARCVLSAAARAFIEELCQSDVVAHDSIQKILLDDLDQSSHDTQTLVYDVVEWILGCKWITISPSRHQRWAQRFWRQGLARGNWAVWYQRLREYGIDPRTNVEIELATAFGLCQRRLGELDGARDTFDSLVSRAGRAGLFVEQSRALYELAVTLRYQGEYEQAVMLTARAERIAQRYQDDSLLNAIRLEQAQIALDRSQPETVLEVIPNLPRAARTLVIWSEACLLSGQIEDSLNLARQALSHAQEDRDLEARLYGLLGRCYERLGDTDSAHNYLAAALTLLERQSDPLGLARTQSNLGALFIEIGEYEGAKLLLDRAGMTQSQLNDRVGLAYTQHNQTLLTIRRAAR